MKPSTFCALILLSMLFMNPSTQAAEPANELATIQKQLCEQLTLAPDQKENRLMGGWSISNWNETFSSDGTWKDVDYADQTRGGWKTATHLRRLFEMTKVYASPQHPLHHDPKLGEAIHAALNHWLDKDYRCPNWWYNEIDVPSHTAKILLLLDKEVSPSEFERGIKIIERAKIGMTGQNRVWLSEANLMRGLLQKNYALVKEAAGNITQEIVISEKEGLQQDFSFHQHGPQLQQGNYGLAFAFNSVQWIIILRGTSLAVSEEKTALIRDFLLKGEEFVVWKKYMDISSCGRQIFPNQPASKASRVLQAITFMKTGDSSHASEYQAAMDRLEEKPEAPALSGNKYFWRSDYLVHRRPNYYASTKMSSLRVIGAECVNNENLCGHHLGSGATYVYVSGTEYENIFPVWDWRRVPGVTCEQTYKLLRPAKSRNQSPFVGGISDGTYGASVIDYKEKEPALSYKKSWFYFDDQIVCLGTAISSPSENAITTSINQCLQQGDSIIDDGKNETVLKTGTPNEVLLKWAFHNSIGYIFPENQKIKIGVQEQSGTWSKVFSAGSNEKIAKPVFSLWIDHGIKPADARYSYILLPATTREQVQAFATRSEIEILQNTSDLQAVKNTKLKITSAVFYKSGSIEYAKGKILSVDQPCLVMIRETDAIPQITLSDPTQQLKEISLTLDQKSHPIKLHNGLFAGSSTTLKPE